MRKHTTQPTHAKPWVSRCLQPVALVHSLLYAVMLFDEMKNSSPHWPPPRAVLYCTRPAPCPQGSSGCLGTCTGSFAAAEARSWVVYLSQRPMSRPTHGKADLLTKSPGGSEPGGNGSFRELSDGKAHQCLWWRPALSSCTGSHGDLQLTHTSVNWQEKTDVWPKTHHFSTVQRGYVCSSDQTVQGASVGHHLETANEAQSGFSGHGTVWLRCLVSAPTAHRHTHTQ